MAQVMLFNIHGEKLMKIRMLLYKLGVHGREVPEEDFGKTLEELRMPAEAAPSKKEPDAAQKPLFTREMLVMDGLTPEQFNALLEGLRKAEAQVALKAVLTKHNLSWSPAKLCRELSAEHAAFERSRKK